MWQTLGFRESPYNTNPLRARPEDVDLLVGRESESTDLCTQLESASHGVLVLSGAPGVGKTSFFNVQQYLLEQELAAFGPKVLAARHLCPVQPNDDLRTLALRALDSLYRSVEAWCALQPRAVPKETANIGKWLAGTGSSGFSLGISILGSGGSFGRSAQLPKASDASFEAITDAITAVTSEIVNELKFDCAVITLDNLENLEDEQLGTLLISFRDTLFSIPNVWWILIGQSGLGSLIQSLDPRVFERTTGSGIEMKPIDFAELEQAIAVRVTRFHISQGGKPPLMSETHRSLFEASFGETRFVFKYGNSICAKFVERIRANILTRPEIKAESGTAEGRRRVERAVDEAIGKGLIQSQIPAELARSYLREIVENELNGLFLKPKEKQVLAAIGKAGQARPSDYKAFSLKTMQDFSSNYLSKFYNQHLLVRQQEGKAVNYRLRGIAQLSYNYGLLKVA